MAETLTTWRLVAETKEFVGPLIVTVDGLELAAFDVQVQPAGVRPDDTAWEAAITLDAELGVLVGAGTQFPLEPGTKYVIYIRHTDNPEVPVLQAGLIRAI